MPFVISSQSCSLQKKLQRTVSLYYVLPLTSTARLLKTIQVLLNSHISQNYDHAPNISKYATITFVSMCKVAKLKFIQLPPNFKLLTLPQRPYHRIFLFVIGKRFLVINPKCLLIAWLQYHATVYSLKKTHFSTLCLSSNHIWADCHFRF